MALGLVLGAATAAADWEPAAPVDNGGGGFSATSAKSGLTVGANGLATALFVQRRSDTPAGQLGEPFAIRRRSGAGVPWTTPAVVGRPPGGQVDSFATPQLAALGNGGALGVFAVSDASSNRQTLATSWPAAAGAPAAAVQALCTSGASPECAGGVPQVALGGDGTGYAVAQASVGDVDSDILFSRTVPVTGAWQPAQVLALGFQPRLAVDAGGDIVVTYVRKDSSQPGINLVRAYAKRKLASDAGFGAEVQISGTGSVEQGAVVIDGAGDATAAFDEGVPGTGAPLDPVVEAVRWPRSSAAPGAGQQISTSDEGAAGNAALAVDPQDRVTAAWDAFSGGSTVYAAERTAGWGAPQRVSPNDGRSASVPKVAVDADGTATIVYGDAVPPTGSDVDVKAARRFTGEAWFAPVSLRSTAPGAGAPAGASYRVAAARADQADVIFVQQLDGVNRLFATRFSVPLDGYPRPKGATPLRVSLVPAFRTCTSPNSSHGAPFSFGSCRPPVQQSSYLTVGTPDSNGKAARSVGFLLLRTIAGDPSTAANEADVAITTSLTDVRNRNNLSDYTGELKAILQLRTTDRRNSPSGADAGTLSDISFPFTVPCSATPDDSGGTCALSTTANAVMPGAVQESARTIWQLGQIGIYDGGADGLASTADGDSVFATQGVFVP